MTEDIRPEVRKDMEEIKKVVSSEKEETIEPIVQEEKETSSLTIEELWEAVALCKHNLTCLLKAIKIRQGKDEIETVIDDLVKSIIGDKD